MSYLSKPSYLSTPSIYIPYMSSDVTANDIRKVFVRLKLGVIKHIYVRPRTTFYGATYNVAYIYFNKWLNNATSNNIRTKMLMGQDFKIVYDNFSYWKILINRDSHD